MVHPETLGDETESPDHGGEKEEQVGLELHRAETIAGEAGGGRGVMGIAGILKVIRKRVPRARFCLDLFTELA
jgi:hypothetical protein